MCASFNISSFPYKAFRSACPLVTLCFCLCSSSSAAEERSAAGAAVNESGPPGAVAVGALEPQFSGVFSYHIPTNTWKCFSETNNYENNDRNGSSSLLKPRVGHCMLFHPVIIIPVLPYSDGIFRSNTAIEYTHESKKKKEAKKIRRCNLLAFAKKKCETKSSCLHYFFTVLGTPQTVHIRRTLQ